MNLLKPRPRTAVHDRRPQALGRLAGALTALAASAVVLAPSATAAPGPCNAIGCGPPTPTAGLHNCTALGFEGSDDAAVCARITGIDRGSSLRVRSAPSLSAAVVGHRRDGDVVEVDCWTKGPSTHGDAYWVGLYGAGGPTYVNDWYVTTGNPRTWTRQVSHC